MIEMCHVAPAVQTWTVEGELLRVCVLIQAYNSFLPLLSDTP